MPLQPTGGQAVKLFSKKDKDKGFVSLATPKTRENKQPFSALSAYSHLSNTELELYSSLREAVPVIDAAIGKLVRLLGSFEVKTEDERFQSDLDRFVREVPAGVCGYGLKGFLYSYFDQLLTYGTAIGEMIPYSDLSGIGAIYNASLKDVEVVPADSSINLTVRRRDSRFSEIPSQELLFYSLLSPDAETQRGNSILKGLPFVSSILLKIFSSVGANWEKAGNIRYAVTYNPPQGVSGNARQRAKEIASEWSRAMRSDTGVCDFVSVGDVSIKVIGADSQILDCEVPVKQMLEQIVAKLSVPPFLLGLSWSSTERMSSVQADILTSEIEYYRSILTSVLEKICLTHLRMLGCRSGIEVKWDNISLLDEVELADARLKNAQAQKLEKETEEKA